ncbi:MAG: hypothetical protein KIT58_08380, partial [Planctomycetota bacterium]|nr:hypothetical protein [Planctomycetota bacterium]
MDRIFLSLMILSAAGCANPQRIESPEEPPPVEVASAAEAEGVEAGAVGPVVGLAVRAGAGAFGTVVGTEAGKAVVEGAR